MQLTVGSLHAGHFQQKKRERFFSFGFCFQAEDGIRYLTVTGVQTCALPICGENFVTRKVTRGIAQILSGKSEKLRMGNLDSKRDWGHAQDFVEAMWLMLQQDEPDDYVIATGETHSVRDLLDEAFGYLDLDWQPHIEVDPRYYRPAEVDILIGDASKARRQLGWEPKINFQQLVRMMVDADLASLKQKHQL